MRTIAFVKDTAHQYYAPEHYKSSQSFLMQPGSSILVTLGSHGRFDHVTTRSHVGGKILSCHYESQDQLGILVTYCKNDKEKNNLIWIVTGSRLKNVLALGKMSHKFVVINSVNLKTPKRKKRRKNQRKTTGNCGYCPSVSSASSSAVGEPMDSCTTSCNHSDIDEEEEEEEDNSLNQ